MNSGRPFAVSDGEIIASLTVIQKLGQMFLFSFSGKSEIPPAVREMNAKGRLGGVILFSAGNIENSDQLRGLTEIIQKTAGGSPHSLPLLIAADQEGGQLTALNRGATIFPGNMALGTADNEDMTYRAAFHTGLELRHAGINLNLAPVLDISRESAGGVPIPDNRMISSDPGTAARHAVPLVKGTQDAGVMACGKHFPGMRMAEVDTHHQSDLIGYSLEEIERYNIPPFRAAIGAGLEAVMTHHGIFPAFGKLPATLSPEVITYLRTRLGFSGLVISDDLVMKAIRDHFSPLESCIAAILAGIDLIIAGDADEELIERLAGEVKRGRIPEERLDESLRRILRAKRLYALPKKDLPPPEPKKADALALDIACKAVTIENDPGRIIPVGTPDPRTRIGIILANPARLVMADTVNLYDISIRDSIVEAGYTRNVREIILPWEPTREEAFSLLDIAFLFDILIFTTVNAYRFSGQLEVLKAVHARRGEAGRKPVIIAAAIRSPSDAGLLKPYADAVLVTHGTTPVQMRALAVKIFGERR